MAGGSSDFRQDVIDYTWLLDKFESRALEELAKQKEKERPPQNTEPIIVNGTTYYPIPNSNWMVPYSPMQSGTANAAANAANAAANAAATMANAANTISNAANTAANVYRPPTYEVENGYEGGYWGEEKPSLSILPSFFRQRHAHRVGETLSQRAGRGFYARRISVFRMAGRLGMKLAETLDFLHRQVVAGEVQQGINQHRTMSIGQHEPVAVHPFGIGGVVTQMMNP